MAFFEDFGKKISKVGQATVQKTKDFADISKLNSLITEEEKQLNEMYMQIGKKYVELYGENDAAEFADMCTEIRAGRDRIIGFQVEIEKIRGVTRCEKCGAEIALNSGFCSNCGAKIEVKQELLFETVEAESKKLCANCQTELTPGAMFCAECGMKVEP